MTIPETMVEAAARAYGGVLGKHFPHGRGYDQLSRQEIKIAHECALAALEAAGVGELIDACLLLKEATIVDTEVLAEDAAPYADEAA